MKNCSTFADNLNPNLPKKSTAGSHPVFFIAIKITEKILKECRCLGIATPEREKVTQDKRRNILHNEEVYSNLINRNIEGKNTKKNSNCK